MNLQDIAIVGVGTTPQVKRSERNSLQVALDAAKLALADAGLAHTDVDGIAARWPGPGGTELAPGSADWSTLLGVPLGWIGDSYPQGVPALVDAAGAILTGQATTVLITGGQAGVLGGGKVAAYTRPGNEFVEPFGAFTATHFALVAQRHLARFPHARARDGRDRRHHQEHRLGEPRRRHARPRPLHRRRRADRAAGRRPVHAARPVPRVSEGGAAVVVTTLERARDLPHAPVVLLGAGMEWLRQQYVDPARYEQVWSIGATAARQARSGRPGIGPSDVDVAQLYDVNSLEVARQFEALGFCGEGEGTDFALATGIGPDGKLPTCTDGGLLSFSHIGWGAPTLKLAEAVHQVRGTAGERQIDGAEIALAAGAGSGAQYYNLALLGRAR